MRKLNRLIAAGALAVPMALGASGIAMADSSGPLGLGEELQEGDEGSDDGSDGSESEGDDARDSGNELRDELLEIGRDLREGSNDENSNDENSNESSSEESGSEESGSEEEEEENGLDLLGMGGGNFEDNGGGFLG